VKKEPNGWLPARPRFTWLFVPAPRPGLREPAPGQMRPRLCGLLGLIAVLLVSGCCSNHQDLVGQGQSIQSRIQQSAPLNVIPTDFERAKEMVRRGRHYFEQGRLLSAERALKTATEIDPQNNEAWYFLDRVRQELDGGQREEPRRRDLQNEETVMRDQTWQPTILTVRLLYVCSVKSVATRAHLGKVAG
jgi:hypothetical protein